MKKQEFMERMTRIRSVSEDDIGQRHLNADRLLCEALKDFDFTDGVSIFNEMEKWYE